MSDYPLARGVIAQILFIFIIVRAWAITIGPVHHTDLAEPLTAPLTGHNICEVIAHFFFAAARFSAARRATRPFFAASAT